MKIGIIGANGRMGKAVIKEVLANEFTELSGALVRDNSKQDIGEIVGIPAIGLTTTDNLEELFQSSDAIVDFSSPDLAIKCAKMAAKYNKILVSGTTGFSEEQKQELVNCANSAVIVWSSNMSIGVNLLINLSEKVAGILHDDYDAEIFEMHHRNKADSPSGTALSLGEAVAKGRGLNFGEVCRKTRDGVNNKREKNEIGFAALRGGDVIGDHTVIFAGTGERIELSHKASNRDIYARGALRAVIWGSGKKSGFYSMSDVLSL